MEGRGERIFWASCVSGGGGGGVVQIMQSKHQVYVQVQWASPTILCGGLVELIKMSNLFRSLFG